MHDHDDVADALRAHEPVLDDVRRARVLARMSPELDAIAESHAARADRAAGRHRRWWLPILGVAAAAAAFGLWLGRGHAPGVVASQPPVARVDRQLLAPYVVSGVSSEDVAVTLLAGRFATLDLKAGELVRATVDGNRDQRIAAVGPAKLAVGTQADAPGLDLASGTLLVDARDPSHVLHLRAGTVEVRVQNARFGVAVSDHATAIFVDRGELVVDGRHVHAGEWDGPQAQRSQALVAAVRDHGNAIAPDDHGGVAAITGETPIVTEGGAIVGTPPLWARLPSGDSVLVAMADRERRIAVTIHEGTVSHVAARLEPAPAPAPAPDPAPVPEITKPVPSANPPATHPHPIPTATTTAMVTASSLYARAEAALGANDRATAEVVWNELVTRFPSSPQAASALYDLAGLARARGDFAAAQAELAKLADGKAPAALREPSAYLRCRLHVDAHEPTVAADCFRTFRDHFAHSAHDAEVLAWLVGYAQESTGCSEARPLADEYLRRYPHGPFAARAKTCASAP